MTPLRYTQVALGLLIVTMGVTGVLSYRHLAGKAATADARIKAAEDSANEANEALALLQGEIVRRAEFDSAIRETRLQINSRLDKAAHEDPVARDYLGERIPDSVRNAVDPVR